MRKKYIPDGEIRLMMRMPHEFLHSVSSEAGKFGHITHRKSNIISLSARGNCAQDVIYSVRKHMHEKTGIDVEVEEDAIQSLNDAFLITEEDEEVQVPNFVSSIISRIFRKKKVAPIVNRINSFENFVLGTKMYNLFQAGFPTAWEAGYTGKGVVVGVNDTGYGPHDHIVPSMNMNLCDFTESVNERDNDKHGHGTHVAGTIAHPVDREKGIIGAAPDVLLYIFKSGNGTFYTSDLIQAISEGLKYKVNIMNNSWGGHYSGFLQEAISDALHKGMVITKSIGNQDEESTDCYKDCVLVSAFSKLGHPALFSNWVSEKYRENTIAAYGVDIYSALPGNKYGFMSGTSMATPLVTSALALLMQKYPNRSSKDILDILYNRSISSIKKKEYGVGLLDLRKEFAANGKN